PHTGVFRGSIPTGLPAPLAKASDTEEGRSPSCTINSTVDATWTSLADGKAPKWLEVDTMSSHEVARARLTMPEPTAVRQLVLQGLLADEYTVLGRYPADGDDAGDGGLTVNSAEGQRGGRANEIRRYLRFAKVKTRRQSSTAYRRDETALRGKKGWVSARISGAFYVGRTGTYQFRFIHKPGRRQTAHLYLDGSRVVGGDARALERHASFRLVRGVHRLEILLADEDQGSSAVVGVRRSSAAEFEPMPGEWFDPKANPDLADALRGRARIERDAEGFVAHMDEPVRLRKLRWVFERFSSPSITVRELSVADAEGAQVIPVEADFTAGTRNRTLEISPGEQILCAYADEFNLESDTPKKRVKTMNSSFFNGTITLAHEEVSGDGRGRQMTYEPAKRCRTGTQLMLFVKDADEDVTDERDSVEVLVETSSGEALDLKVWETNTRPTDEQSHGHTGVFMEVISFGEKTEGKTIKVAPSDKITVSYLDKENTNPGVLIPRTYTLFEAGTGDPEISFFRTSTALVEDTSEAAVAKIERLKRQAPKGQEITILRQEIHATGQDAPVDARVLPGGEVPVDARAPLLFQIRYPQMAMHRGSVMTATIVSEAELARAAREEREPDKIEVELGLRDVQQWASAKGYPVVMEDYEGYAEEQLLEEGIFSGVVRLQLGTHGDVVDDLVSSEGGRADDASRRRRQGDEYYVPTLLVAGSDVVQVRVASVTTGEETAARAKLLSDARVQLLDPTYTYERDAIHLGQKIFVRLDDPDQDGSGERDKLKVQASAGSGDRVDLELEETMAHSGVFTGSFVPAFVEALPQGEAPTAADDVLHVRFGDPLAFSFVDAASLGSDAPLTVDVAGKIHHGADAELAGFTKRFKDPEMAVKTRFLMAEALFEMAKEHRKLNDKDLADLEIARGKRILEEAMRDYPRTTLAAQGHFLLANLAQELGKFQEAISRYANVIGRWPDSEYAARSQLRKAICLEKLKNFKQATEEYVRLTYLYPDSTLVPDATVRLGNYFYRSKEYKTAGRVFRRFQQRNPNHRLAPKALFLAGQCEMREKRYKESAEMLAEMLTAYPDAEKDVRAEGLYWLAESYTKIEEFRKAYNTFKKLTWDYPESKWAKIARGRLTQASFADMDAGAGGGQ
ncbi:MAG: tetratricopeptide repeat protein, partial [Planctomycetota bacterium]